MKKKSVGNHLAIYLLLTIGAIVMVFPFVWSVLTSFKSLSESLKVPPAIFPEGWNVMNYRDVWSALPLEVFCQYGAHDRV